MDPPTNEPAAAAPVATAVAVFTWIECVLCGARFCSHTRSGWEQSLDIPECGRCSEILKNDKAWGGCAVPTPGQLADDEGELKQEAWAQPGLLPLELSPQPEEGTPKKGSAQLHGTDIKKRKTSGPYADPSNYKKNKKEQLVELPPKGTHKEDFVKKAQELGGTVTYKQVHDALGWGPYTQDDFRAADGSLQPVWYKGEWLEWSPKLKDRMKKPDILTKHSMPGCLKYKPAFPVRFIKVAKEESPDGKNGWWKLVDELR